MAHRYNTPTGTKRRRDVAVGPAREVRVNVNPNEPALDGQRLQRRPIVLPAAVRVWAFTVGLAILAIVLDFGVVEPRAVGPGPLQIPWPLIAAGFCLAELKVVDVHFRREQHSFSLSEFPAVIGLFVLQPPEYLLAVLAGSAVALAVSRQTPLKFAFNLTNFGLGATAALAVFHILATPMATPTLTDWIAAFLATLT